MVVRAVGTQFDVHRRATGTTVTVLEGRVAVVPIVKGNDVAPVEQREQNAVLVQDPSVPQARAKRPRAQVASGEIVLGAGEQVNLHEGAGSAAPERADLQVATALTQQRLVFESVHLIDAAEEFNRFNTRKLTIDPEGLKDFKVSGTFQALDPQSLDRFVIFLRDQGLLVVQSGDSFHIKKNR